MTSGEKMEVPEILEILSQFYSKEEIEHIKEELKKYGKITVVFKPEFNDVYQGYYETDNGMYINLEKNKIILMTPDGNIPLLKK
jgi:hypothetical protein